MLKRLVLVAVALLLMATDVSACNLLGIFGCGGQRGCGVRYAQPCYQPCRQYAPAPCVPCGAVTYTNGTAVYPVQVIPAGYSVPCSNGRCPVPTSIPAAFPTNVPGTVFPPVPLPDNPPKISPTGIPDTPAKPAPKIEPK